MRATRLVGWVPGLKPRAESLNRFAVNPTDSRAKFSYAFRLRRPIAMVRLPEAAFVGQVGAIHRRDTKTILCLALRLGVLA